MECNFQKAFRILQKSIKSQIVYDLIVFIFMFGMIEYMYRETLGHVFNVFTEHVINIGFDISVICSVLLLVCCFRKKLCLFLANVLVFILVIVNLGYFRVFNSFCSMSAITEVSNLAELDLFAILHDIYKISDIVVVILLLSNLYLIKKSNISIKSKYHWTYPALAIFFFLSFQFLNPIQRSIRQHTKLKFPTYNECLGERFEARWCFGTNMLVYEFGIVRTQVYFGLLSLFQSNITLSDKDIEDISHYYTFPKKPISYSIDGGGKNIVLVLVESLLSSSIRHEIRGQAVTPCIDSLLNVKGTWSNLRVKPNISAGMSSDGQYIIFTGLLPFRNTITVKQILNKEVMGLPRLFAETLHCKTAITIPTSPGLWHQSECSKKYGFMIENSTCTETKPQWGTDKEVFEKAITIDRQLSENYFHCILTSSMHSSYDHLSRDVTYFNIEYPASYSKEYRNYLSECHYFDKHLRDYINALKRIHMWDRTILIIVADHHAQIPFLKMNNEVVKEEETPLIIVNADIDEIESVQGEVNQVDIYPSLIDLFGLKSVWRGVGKSFFRTEEYNNEITDNQYIISEKIINSNYFQIFSK